MKSSFPIKCSCGHVVALEATGTASFPDTTCPVCHSGLWIVDDGVVSTRVYNKALEELRGGDFTLSIILSAMAVECDLARLYVKWNEVDLIPGGQMQATQDQVDLWAQNLRSWMNIAVRLDKICEFLTGENFDTFIRSCSDLVTSIRAKHPGSADYASYSKFFQEHLFWKRNQIVHMGKIDLGRTDAEECLQIATTLFEIGKEMDGVRRKRLPTM